MPNFSLLIDAMHFFRIDNTVEQLAAIDPALVPPNIILSLEVPMRWLADSGMGPRDRVARCVAAARSLLANAAVWTPDLAGALRDTHLWAKMIRLDHLGLPNQDLFNFIARMLLAFRQ